MQHFAEFNPPFTHQLFIVVMFPLVCLLVSLLVFAAPFAKVEDGPEANWLHFIALGAGAGLVYQVRRARATPCHACAAPHAPR